MDVIHVIDALAPVDMLDQMLSLRRSGEKVVSLGPAPAYPPLGPVQTLHAPLGLEDLCSRRLAKIPLWGSVIHAWSATVLKAACSAAERIDGKVVFSMGHLPYGDALAPLVWDIGRFGCTVTVPTTVAKERLLGAGADPTRAAVLPPTAESVDQPAELRSELRRGLGLSDEHVLMAAPSEMIRPAGHKWASWSHAIVRNILPNGRLIFPGAGPLESAVRFFANTTGYIDEAYFTGYRFTIPAVLAGSDIGLFFYEKDCGLVRLVRAMAAGLPILAGATEDISEICRHEENALLVRCGDPRGASAAMLRLMDEPDLAGRLGRQARNDVLETLAPERVRNRLEKIYATCP
jgi:hypothetical protein